MTFNLKIRAPFDEITDLKNNVHYLNITNINWNPLPGPVWIMTIDYSRNDYVEIQALSSAKTAKDLRRIDSSRSFQYPS